MRSAPSLEAGRPPSLLVRWGAPLASPPRPGSPASFPCPHRAAGKGEAQGARADARAEEEWLGVRRCANWGCGRQARTPRPAPRSYPTRPGRHLASSTPLLSARGGIRTRRPRGRYPELRPYPRTPPAPWPRPARPRPAPLTAPPRPCPLLRRSPRPPRLSPATRARRAAAESSRSPRPDALRPQCPPRPPRPGRAWGGQAERRTPPPRPRAPACSPLAAAPARTGHGEGDGDGRRRGAAVAAAAAAARRR